MPSWADFFTSLDFWSLLDLLITAAASLLCIIFHEVSHGVAAYCLGDQTAKRDGRLSLNPLRHIDLVGLLMMLAVGVGWAKPVPVNPGNFRNPRKGMAFTALAGPVSNLLLALLALMAEGWIARRGTITLPVLVGLCLLSNVALLSVGLGIFNLIPIPPLDGSKVLGVLLPDRIYRKALRYERYGMILVVFFALSGFLDGPLSWLIGHALTALCELTGCPAGLIYATLDLSVFLR